MSGSSGPRRPDRRREPGRLPGVGDSEQARARELREEMEAHIAHRVDDLMAEGASEEAARRQAEGEFGDPHRYQEEIRRSDGRLRRRQAGATLLEQLRQDLSYALRQLRRDPGFAAVAVGTLALGVGAAVAIVAVVRAVALDPLPFEDADRLVAMEMVTPAGGWFSVSEPAFLDWAERLERYEGVAATASRGATLRAPGEPRSIIRGYLNAGGFELLGAEMLLGREFTAQEDRPIEPAPVAMISESFWRSAFGADPQILGASVDLDGRNHEVVGVFAESLEFLMGDVPVVTPLSADPAMDRGEHYLTVVGRLPENLTLAEAREDLAAVTAWQSATYEEDRGWGSRVTPLKEATFGKATLQAGWILLAAAGLLLVMACVNVSNLLLARGSTRTREIGVRAALGAHRLRIFRQLFTEAGVLAVAGGTLGAALAAVALPLVRSVGAGRIPRIESAVMEPRVLMAALVATGVATILFGWAPALSLHRVRLVEASARGTTSGGRRTRRILVAGQLAASVVLLLGTGLLLRSFASLSRVEVGLETEGRYVMNLALPDASYSWQVRGELLRGLEEELAAIPGVRAVGATAVDPLVGGSLANFVARQDRMPDRAEEFTPIAWRAVTPGFFEAAGVSVQAGRAFEYADYGDGQMSPVVMDARLAGLLYHDPGEALGEVLVWGDPNGSRIRVTGVVENIRDVSLSDEAPAMLYRIYSQIPWATMTVVIQSDRTGADLAQAVREAVARSIPGLPVPELRSFQGNMDRALAEPRFNAVVLAVFAGLGLTLAVVGLYGLTTFEVRQRFREIGIRLTLGARPESIQSLILRDRLLLAGIGIGAGAGLFLLLRRSVGALLHGVTPNDPVTWLGTMTILGLTALGASYVPARRATRVDPRSVLNEE